MDLNYGVFKQNGAAPVNLDHENFADLWNNSDCVVHISTLKTVDLAQDNASDFKQGASRQKNQKRGTSRRGD